MNYPSGILGTEFFAGGADQIGAAILRGNWEALRMGDISVTSALFPPCVYCLDILLLPEAIEQVTGNPRVEITEYVKSVAGEEGLWGAEVLPPEWVASVGAIAFADVPRLRMRWMEIHMREYEPEPQLIERDWMDDSMLRACEALVSLAKLAIRDSLEVVEVWAQ